MPCLIVGCLALFAPRIAIVLVVLFSDFIGTAYRTWLVPLLGFFFLPLTTLAYAWAWHAAPNHSVSGGYLVVVIVAVLVDLGLLGGGASSRKYGSAGAGRRNVRVIPPGGG